MKKSLVLIAVTIVVFSAISITLSTTAQVKTPTAAENQQEPATAANQQADQPGKQKSLEDFDIRANVARSLTLDASIQNGPNGLDGVNGSPGSSIKLPARARNARESRFFRERPRAQTQFSSLTGTPSRIFGLQQSLTDPSSADAEVTARRFLKNNSDLFHLSNAEVDGLKVARRNRTEASGMTHIFLQQQVNEIEVFQGNYAFHLDRDGAIVATSGELMPEASKVINLVRPRLSSIEALRRAAEYGEVEIKGSLRLRKQAEGNSLSQVFSKDDGGGVFARDVEARLVYFPLSANQMRLAWELILWKQETPDTYLILVDAERGSLLYRYNMTWQCFEAPASNTSDQTRGVSEGASPHRGGNRVQGGLRAEAKRGASPKLFPAPFSGLNIFAAITPAWFYRGLEPGRALPFSNAASARLPIVAQTTQTPHGLVFTNDSPRPNVPVVSNNPALVSREDLPFRPAPFNGTVIFGSNDPHFDWWAGQPATGLISNNVDTRLDRDGSPNQPDQPRLAADDGNFSFPIDFTKAPACPSSGTCEQAIIDNQKAAQVNLFYWANRYHDIMYAYGFTEGWFNFQTNNFGLGGVGGDAILADAQDGSGTNNANFSTPRDGQPGRVQMFLWTSAKPRLDGDFDQGVIIHELSHGLSNRLVGNAVGLSGMQSRGMGEGWSDYFGIVLLRKESDDLDGNYAVGQYVTNDYTNGIRRAPYSTNTQIYPFNFGGIERSNEVHNVGEIWCNTLLEMRAQLIRKYGFQEGQRQSIQLVVDGLKLTPTNPSFLDARNAIMLADRVNNGGANQCVIWQAFAKHGMGFFASTTGSSDNLPVESFDAPACSDLGSLWLNQKNYLVGETVTINLGDRNASTTPGALKITVKSSVTNDQETVTLAPNAVFNGIFSASVRVVAGGANAGDGSLQASVQAGDKIIISYADANSGGGASTQVTAQADVVGEKLIFEDDVEQGNKGWNNGGSPTPTWAITSERSASPSRSWTDSPGANYLNNSNTYLVSPPLNLTGSSGVTLTFAHRYSLELDFDYGFVEYSIDDGLTWKRAAVFTGDQITAFAQARIKLDALSGEPKARIRFRLTSDEQVVGDGWTIDDIRVLARSSDLNYLGPQSALAPSIAAVSPAFGSPNGNTTVTITGQNFTENSDVKVFFDNLPATSVRVFGGTTLTAVTPAHAAGAVAVRVETKYGAAVLSNVFTYFVTGSVTTAPQLISIFPSSGATGGKTSVTVNGSNFTPDTTVAFGSLGVTTTTFVNSNTLRVVTPASPNSATGAVDVTAKNPSSTQSKLANAFNYIAPTPPTVKVLSPNGGESLFAGNVVTLRWQSSDNKAVARHRIGLYRSNTTTPTLVATISSEVAGEAQALNWTIPITTAPITIARIGVTAVDDEGVETTAFSSGDFTIDRRWQQPLTPLPTGLNRMAVTSDGQYLYTIGGRTGLDNSTSRAIVQRLDPAATTPAWSSEGLAPLPVGLNAIEAAVIQGKIYVPGGFTFADEVDIDRNTRVYDIAGGAWSTQPPPPVSVGNYALAADTQQGILYVTGGSDLNKGVSNVQAYDTRNNMWQALPPMTMARFAHEAAIINGKLYVVGGVATIGGLSEGEVYDFQSGKWSPIASMNRPRFYAVSAVARNESGQFFWLVFGGANPDTGVPINSAEAYDVANNRWIVLEGSFPSPTLRSFANGATHNGFLYAVGGSTNNTTSTSLNERFKLDGFKLISPNQPPLVVVPSVRQIAIPNRELRFSVSGQDLGSGAPITLTADGAPDGAVFTPTNDTNNSARGEFRWTPQSSDVGREITVNFTASDGTLNDVKSVAIRVVSASQLTPVNAADFHLGPIAADSVVAAFGVNLATRVDVAQSLPLPTSLSGTTLTINGVPAPLLFVSPMQINFLVPSTVPPGPAVFIVSSPLGTYALGEAQIVASAPAIFTADSSGKGDAAALATVDGVNYQSQPFDVLVNGKPNVVVLYGTGIRRAPAANPGDNNGVAESVSVTIDGRNANVLYAGAQGSFSGLDQINVEMPAALAGTGPRRVEVIVTVNNVVANHVTIQIK
jgi:uncharacterized protein (TIGR03437 family)